MNKLNEKKTFGVINGHPDYKYVQDGKYFDTDKNEILEVKTPEVKAPKNVK